MSNRSKVTWLVVGDAAAAQFYVIHAVPLRLTKVPAGTLKANKVTTHGVEHKSRALHVAHTAAGRGDHDRHENVFVEHIADALDAAARDSEYDDAIVVLPPKALAHFRKVVRPNVRKRIKHEISADWTRLSMPDMEQHVAAALP